MQLFVYCLYSSTTLWWWSEKRPKHVGEWCMMKHTLLVCICWFVT